MQHEEAFTAWLYANFAIGNGDTLIAYLETPELYDAFLLENNLTDPEDSPNDH
jgi:hypothetical protein